MANVPTTDTTTRSNDRPQNRFSSLIVLLNVNSRIRPLSPSQLSPELITDWQPPPNDIFPRRRQPLLERQQTTEVTNHTTIVNIRDLDNLEDAYRCRLLSRAEYEILRTQREIIRHQENEEQNARQRLVAPHALRNMIYGPVRNESEANNTLNNPAAAGFKREYMMEDGDRKIILEFCHLLEKSKVLFNGLRELPQYGHKQWQSYFGRTFDVYTKLWKFQQQHREVLDSKYGLKRWQIGEIASKIGQLYYHFYLRTSETAYLREAFAFYQAIRSRRYYTHAVKEDKCELMVKKLRYYARFIVVSLLLNRLKLVDDLIRELDNQIIEYGTAYHAEDQMEWTVVVDEVKAFLDAEPAVQVLYNDMPVPDLSNRIHPDHTPYMERGPHMYLSLQDVIIIGSSTQQAKFSELTIDMYRILQILEKEPIGHAPQALSENIPPHGPPPAPHSTQRGYVVGDSFRRDNPHKYLLFKPTALQCLVYLASSCNDLPLNGAILLYISADGYIPSQSRNTDNINGYDGGGFITSGKLDPNRDSSRESRSGQQERGSRGKDQCLLYPGDIYPFTKRPLFIIVESNCSGLMQNIPRHFNQPLVMLMSAQELPSSLADRNHQGNLLTLFLNNPLMGFCTSCEVYTIDEGLLDVCEPLVLDFMFQCIELILRIRIDMNFFAFMGDEFLRTIILRYLFCECALRMNRNFRSRSQIVRSTPPMPEELLAHSSLASIIFKIADHLGVRNIFSDVSGPGTGSREQN